MYREIIMILGVTGAFGCGKSAVLSAFAARGWHTADADCLCHELYADPDSASVKKFAERWGTEILTPDGRVDRRRLAAIVFSDIVELEYLTGILYPELSRKLDTLIGECRRDGVNGVFEIPLLYEAGFERMFDRIVAVWAAPAIRYARLREQRNFSEAEVRRREARQLVADAKMERADYALINNGSRSELEMQTDRLLENLKGAER